MNALNIRFRFFEILFRCKECYILVWKSLRRHENSIPNDWTLTNLQLNEIGLKARRCMHFDRAKFWFHSIIDLITQWLFNNHLKHKQLKIEGESHLIVIELFIRHLSVARFACIKFYHLNQSMYLHETVVSCEGGTILQWTK